MCRFTLDGGNSAENLRVLFDLNLSLCVYGTALLVVTLKWDALEEEEDGDH